MFKNEFQGGNFVEVFVAKDPPQKNNLIKKLKVIYIMLLVQQPHQIFHFL